MTEARKPAVKRGKYGDWVALVDVPQANLSPNYTASEFGTEHRYAYGFLALGGTTAWGIALHVALRAARGAS